MSANLQWLAPNLTHRPAWKFWSKLLGLVSIGREQTKRRVVPSSGNRVILKAAPSLPSYGLSPRVWVCSMGVEGIRSFSCRNRFHPGLKSTNWLLGQQAVVSLPGFGKHFSNAASNASASDPWVSGHRQWIEGSREAGYARHNTRLY
jgi:hypothetical protein